MSCVSTVGLALPDFVRRDPDGFAFNVRIFSFFASMPIPRRILAFGGKLPTKAPLANEMGELELSNGDTKKVGFDAVWGRMLALTERLLA